MRAALARSMQSSACWDFVEVCQDGMRAGVMRARTGDARITCEDNAGGLAATSPAPALQSAETGRRT